MTVSGLGPHAHAHWPALRVSLCVSLALAATVLTGHPEWSGYAVFGSICSVTGKQSDYRARLTAQAGTGALLVLAVVTGTAISLLPGSRWWVLPAVGVFSALGALAGYARDWRPVPSLFLVFALGALARAPQEPFDVLVAAAVSGAA
ncbi:MAG: hypothetical protein ACFNME_10785, partial [Actinomyces dentalis]